ncbi:MAG: indoleacetamide hydrolase [Dehalococcoidia bacterium]
MHSFSELDVNGVADAVAKGDITAESYAAFVFDQAERHRYLNAFITFDSERLMRDARAADQQRLRGRKLPRLHGVPIAIKDNIDVSGFPTSVGTPALIAHDPTRTAPVVQSLLESGALVAGKLNMHEIAMGATSDNARFGTVKNPYATEAIPGGSSGGSAAAVAARLVPGSLGTDTIGSVRIPASLCGLVGFRPSIGRYPMQGIVPLSMSRDAVGPIVRTVADAMLLDSIMAGGGHVIETKLEGLRLGVPRSHFFRNLDPAVERVTEQALRLLQEMGAVLVTEDIAELEHFDTSGSFAIIFHEVRLGLARYLEESRSETTLETLVANIASPDVKALAEGWYLEDLRSVERYQYEMSVVRPKLQCALSTYFRMYGLDAIVFPTTPQPALKLKANGMLSMGPEAEISQLIYLQNTDPGSYVGLPGITLPIGMTPEGLPIGLALDAPYGRDSHLLSIAAQIESVLERIPPPNLPATGASDMTL